MTEFELQGKTKLKVRQIEQAVNATHTMQREVRRMVDVEGDSRAMERAFIGLSVAFCAAYVIFNGLYVRKVKKHFKDCKL